MQPEQAKLAGAKRRSYPADVVARGVAALAEEHRPAPIDEDVALTVVFKTPPSTHDLDALESFAHRFGLTIDGGHQFPHSRRVLGTVARVQRAFQVRLEHRESKLADGSKRVHRALLDDEIALPPALAPNIEAVLGFDTHPIARVKRIRQKSALQSRSWPSGTFTPQAIAEAYAFPANSTGAGQCIALIELGGGFSASDVDSYFHRIGIATPPKLVSIGVDGGKNAPDGPNGADGEVVLDIEVSGGVAPGARIAVYFAANTDAAFYDAIVHATHDATNKPSVISISWGGPEDSWSTQSLTAFNSAFASAGTAGVTVCVAAGDDGSSDGESGVHVDFPASSPNVLACGGTKLVASGSHIASEVVWNETAIGEGAGGGGVSTFFAQPSYQSADAVPKPPAGSRVAKGRGVPDVAGNADPETGYAVHVDGEDTVIGGTSAVAPLWAGLVARCNALTGKHAGFLNPVLYAHESALRDITEGNNGAYAAHKGWDACTGLGSPIGTAVLHALSASHRAEPSAGDATKPEHRRIY